MTLLRKNQGAVLRGLTGAAFLLTCLAVNDAGAQQLNIYPAQGQTPQQQEIDKAACQDYAKSQTGFDPQQALEQAGTQANATPPPAIRARKRAREEKAEINQQNQQKSQMQQKLQAYNKAEAVCLKGKGYSVG